MSVNPYADNFESGGYFYNPIRQDLAMVLGDTLAFAFQVQGLDGERPDDIKFTVKENIEDDEPLFVVSLANTIDLRSYDESRDLYTYTVRIPPYRTQHLNLGRYYYDLVFVVNNDVLTLLKGRLLIDYSVTTGLDPLPPEYENGDDILYPRDDIPVGSIKLYTEQYINNLIRKINEITGSANDYTVQTIEPQIEIIKETITEIVTVVQTIGGGSGDIPLSEIPDAVGNLPQNGLIVHDLNLTFSACTIT